MGAYGALLSRTATNVLVVYDDRVQGPPEKHVRFTLREIDLMSGCDEEGLSQILKIKGVFKIAEVVEVEEWLG